MFKNIIFLNLYFELLQMDMSRRDRTGSRLSPDEDYATCFILPDLSPPATSLRPPTGLRQTKIQTMCQTPID